MKQLTEIDPLKRNVSVNEQIEALDSQKEHYLQQRQEKQLELDMIDSDISFVEAQIANILMNKKRRKRCDEH